VSADEAPGARVPPLCVVAVAGQAGAEWFRLGSYAWAPALDTPWGNGRHARRGHPDLRLEVGAGYWARRIDVVWRLAVELDPTMCGVWLLDWLYNREVARPLPTLPPYPPDASEEIIEIFWVPPQSPVFDDAAPFFAELGFPSRSGYDAVSHLLDLGLITVEKPRPASMAEYVDYRPGGEPRALAHDDVLKARITDAGMRVAEAVRCSRQEFMPPGAPMRQRALCWLYRQEVRSGAPVAALNFLVSDYASRGGKLQFNRRELENTLSDLRERKLITARTAEAESGTGVFSVTREGSDCVQGHNGDVDKFADRNAGTASSIHISNSQANVSIGSPGSSQNIADGASLINVLRFADYISEVAALLQPGAGCPHSFAADAATLREAATSTCPDKSRVRNLADALVRALRNAAPAVVSQTAIELGEKAIHALGG
jgi:hypothetical protein